MLWLQLRRIWDLLQCFNSAVCSIAALFNHLSSECGGFTGTTEAQATSEPKTTHYVCIIQSYVVIIECGDMSHRLICSFLSLVLTTFFVRFIPPLSYFFCGGTGTFAVRAFVWALTTVNIRWFCLDRVISINVSASSTVTFYFIISINTSNFRFFIFRRSRTCVRIDTSFS